MSPDYLTSQLTNDKQWSGNFSTSTAKEYRTVKKASRPHPHAAFILKHTQPITPL